MLFDIYYATNYASIIDSSLPTILKIIPAKLAHPKFYSGSKPFMHVVANQQNYFTVMIYILISSGSYSTMISLGPLLFQLFVIRLHSQLPSF